MANLEQFPWVLTLRMTLKNKCQLVSDFDIIMKPHRSQFGTILLILIFSRFILVVCRRCPKCDVMGGAAARDIIIIKLHKILDFRQVKGYWNLFLFVFFVAVLNVDGICSQNLLIQNKKTLAKSLMSANALKRVAKFS